MLKFIIYLGFFMFWVMSNRKKRWDQNIPDFPEEKNVPLSSEPAPSPDASADMEISRAYQQRLEKRRQQLKEQKADYTHTQRPRPPIAPSRTTSPLPRPAAEKRPAQPSAHQPGSMRKTQPPRPARQYRIPAPVAVRDLNPPPAPVTAAPSSAKNTSGTPSIAVAGLSLNAGQKKSAYRLPGSAKDGMIWSVIFSGPRAHQPWRPAK